MEKVQKPSNSQVLNTSAFISQRQFVIADICFELNTNFKSSINTVCADPKCKAIIQPPLLAIIPIKNLPAFRQDMVLINPCHAEIQITFPSFLTAFIL
jgi:hypothetical protein